MHALLPFLISPLVQAAPAAEPLTIEMRGDPCAVLPRGLTSFGAEAVDGWLYVFGGYHGEPHRYTKEGQSDEFLRLNLRDPGQIEMLDGGKALQGAQLAAWHGEIVRVGGMVAKNGQDEKADLHSVAEVAAYDTRTRTWSALPALPTPRSSHDIEVIGDTLVVLGGWTLDGANEKKFCSTVDMLDLAHTETGWRSVPAPFRRRALSAVRVGSRVAAIGGMDDDDEVRPSVDVFDPASGAWTKAPEFPGAAFGVAACAVDGGVLASGRDGVLWRLDPALDAWTRAGTLAFPRFFHQFVTGDGGDVFAVGGIDDMRKDGRVRHIERLAARRPPDAIVSVLEIPAPFVAKNRQGVFLRGNVLTLFGGNRSLKQHDFGPEDFRAETFAFDLATLTWKPRAPFPEGRQTVSTAIVGKDAVGVAVGGFGFTDGRAMARDAGYRYSFSADAWEPAASFDLPHPRTQFALIENAGRLWLFGGLDYDPSRKEASFAHPTEVLELDLANESAHFGDSGIRLPQPRRAFACASLGGKAFLVGGMREEFDIVEDCEAFDFESRTFAPIAAPRRARVSAEMVAMGGKLYLCGGSSAGEDDKLTPNGSIECYDPATNTWKTVVETLPVPMKHSRAFALRDRLLLVSSHVDGPPTTRVVIVAP